MVIHIDKNTWERFKTGDLVVDNTTDNLLSGSVTCSKIALEVYHKTAHINPEKGQACRFFYFDVLSFMGKVMFPAIVIRKSMLISITL